VVTGASDDDGNAEPWWQPATLDRPNPLAPAFETIPARPAPPTEQITHSVLGTFVRL